MDANDNKYDSIDHLCIDSGKGVKYQNIALINLIIPSPQSIG